MKHIIFFIGLLVFSSAVSAQDFSQYQKKEFVLKGDTLRYRILYPVNFDRQKHYPLVVFLHGSGERGSDNEKQLVHGGSLFLDPSNRKKFPAIVVFPQCPEDSTWASFRVTYGQDSVRRFIFPLDAPATLPMQEVRALIRSLVKEKNTDTRRIYIGGLSLGGFGTFDALQRYPRLFAAAFPICGAGNPEAVSRYNVHTPVWIFHGGKDNVVPPVNDSTVYRAMQQRGMDVHYTLFPNDGHDSWDDTFADPDLLPWLFSKKK